MLIDIASEELRRERENDEPQEPEGPLPNGYMVCREVVIRAHIRDAETAEEAEAIYAETLRGMIEDEDGFAIDGAETLEPTYRMMKRP